MNRIGLMQTGPALFAWLLVAPLHAQQVLLSAHGQNSNDFLGTASSVGPDLDGDGFAEIAVGATGLHNGAKQVGGALILSGRDFSIYDTVYGAQDLDSAGYSVAWCGDVDNDGVADLAVGAPDFASSVGAASGQVRIHSGQTGIVIRAIKGATKGGWFGKALADLGDVNGDGIDDLLVGAPFDPTNGGGAGRVLICSGSDGSTLLAVDGDPGSKSGWSVANVGDLDADLVNDFAVGAPSADGPHQFDRVGSVRVHSGATGAKLWEFDGSEGKCFIYSGSSYYIGDALGMSTGAAGDFDGDGVPDFWAASLCSAGNCYGPAYIAVYSGATGATLLTMDTNSETQVMASAIGDLDGDGRTDFIGEEWGGREIQVFSSLNGRVIWRTDAPHSGFVGGSLSPAGDRDGDGRADFLVGAAMDDVGGRETGTIELLAANDLWLDVLGSHFPGLGQILELRANFEPPGNLAALFLTGVNGAPRFDLLLVTTFDASSSALFGSGTVPNGLSGNEISLRALAIDAAGRLVQSIDEELSFQ